MRLGRRGLPRAPNALSRVATAFLDVNEGAGDGGVGGGGVVAVAEGGDLVEESAVTQGGQDLYLVADLGALWCGRAPWRGVEGADERVDHGDRVRCLLGQGGSQAGGAGLDGLIGSRGGGGRKLLQ